MKTLIVLLLIVLSAVTAQAQVFVEFTWTQPDSTQGTVLTNGETCCRLPIPDGGLVKYEIFVATPSDTIKWGEVGAPHSIAQDVVAAVPFTMLTPSSIRVRAIDTRGNVGSFSEWSDPFTVDPGAPESSGKPQPIRVYFGG